MAADAILMYGTRLYDSPTGAVYTEYSAMKSVGSAGSPDAPDVDITPLADATNDFREFRQGLAVAGECTCVQYYSKARMARVIAAFRLFKYWKIIFPDHATPSLASNLVFAGRIKKYTTPKADDPDDKAMIEFTIKISGGLTFTQGS